MPVPPALRRLLRIRLLQEERERQIVEAHAAHLRTLEAALAAHASRVREARSEIYSGIVESDPASRQAGLVASRVLAGSGKLLEAWASSAATHTELAREQWIGKRTERRQAETLLSAAAAEDAACEARRAQQALDNWFLVRKDREASHTAHAECASPTRTAPDCPTSTRFDNQD